MKIFNWIASVVLLSVLAVSTASAATFYFDYADPTINIAAGNTYEATDPTGDSVVILNTAGPFTHIYTFNVTDAVNILTTTGVSVISGLSWIADLTFQWDSNPAVVASNGSGAPLTTLFNQVLTPGLHTLTVTGNATINTNQAAYDFSIITSAVPIPAAFWLFGSALVAFLGFGRRSTTA